MTRSGIGVPCTLTCPLLVLTLASIALAAESPQQIFDSVRSQVIRQLKQNRNYTCVETIEREYFHDLGRRACSGAALTRQLFMRDQLRLDVAVSDWKEIFGWHGASQFSDDDVTRLASSGPISSGSFVGYLQNIFFEKRVHMAYLRPANAGQPLTFEYSVPIEASQNFVTGQSRGKRFKVAFHGRALADPETRQLLSMTVNDDNPPRPTGLCSSETEITYQTVDISGSPSRLPKRITLSMDNDAALHTVSRIEYQSCRAFRGESTVEFQPSNSDGSLPSREAPRVVTVPSNLVLSIRLDKAIDDRSSYTGDPVEGVLTSGIHFGKERIAKGARVSGVITLLQHHFLPTQSWTARVRITRIQDGNHTYLTDAQPLFSGRPFNKESQARQAFVWQGDHIPSSSPVSGEWLTESLSDKP